MVFALIKTEGLDEVSRTRITREALIIGDQSDSEGGVTRLDSALPRLDSQEEPSADIWA